MNRNYFKIQLEVNFDQLFYTLLHRLTNHPSFRCVLVCVYILWVNMAVIFLNTYYY